MCMTPELILLVERAQEGEIEAFTALVEYFEPRIRTFLVARLGDYDEADDLTQQVFLKAWLNLENLHEAACFKRWLYCIAKRLGCDYWRGKKVACQSWEDLALDARVASSPGPEDDTEVADLIQRAFVRLSSKLRQCLLLDVEGFSPREIAGKIDISAASVGTYISLARRRFRAIYRELENESAAKQPLCL